MSELFIKQQGSTLVDSGTEGITINSDLLTMSSDAPTLVSSDGSGSFYFDGTVSGETVPGIEVNTLNTSMTTLGTDEFTIDFWVKPEFFPATDGKNVIMGMNHILEAAYKTPLWLYIDENGYLTLALSDDEPTSSGDEYTFYILNPGKIYAPLTLNTWAHIAITRKDGNVYFFKDGELIYVLPPDFTNSNSTAMSAPYSTSSDPFETRLRIGKSVHDTEISDNLFMGYLANIRIDTTEAYWDSDFELTASGIKYVTEGFVTPDALPVSTNANIFLKQDGASITNAGIDTIVESDSGLTIAATPSPGFDAGSYYFDGTSASQMDLNVSGTEMISFGSNNFTIDFWIYPSTLNDYQTIIGMNSSADSSTYISPFYIGLNPDDVSLDLLLASNPSSEVADIYDTWEVAPICSMAVDEWAHIAITRYNSKIYVFKNGSLKLVLDAERTSGGTTVLGEPQNGEIHFGRDFYNGSTVEYMFTGYLSNVRMDANEAYWNRNFDITSDEAMFYTSPASATENQGIFFLTGESGLVDSTGNFSELTVNDASIYASDSTVSKCDDNSIKVSSFSWTEWADFATTNAVAEVIPCDWGVTGSFSFDLWFKLDTISEAADWMGTGVQVIEVTAKQDMGGGEYTTPDMNQAFIAFKYSPSADTVTITIKNNLEEELSATTANTGDWMHIAAVGEHEGTGNMLTCTFYANGQVIGTSSSFSNMTGYYWGEVRVYTPGVVGDGYYVDNIRLNADATLWTAPFNAGDDDAMFYNTGTIRGGGSGDTGSSITTVVDTAVPNNVVTSPTPSVTLSGTAPANTVEVTWDNVYKDASGTASGTTEWVAEDIPLNKWKNKIKITAEDDEGGTTTEEVVVQYLPNYNKLSHVYGVESSNGNIRGKAKEGYVRGTMKELRSSKHWKATLKD